MCSTVHIFAEKIDLNSFRTDILLCSHYCHHIESSATSYSSNFKNPIAKLSMSGSGDAGAGLSNEDAVAVLSISRRQSFSICRTALYWGDEGPNVRRVLLKLVDIWGFDWEWVNSFFLKVRTAKGVRSIWNGLYWGKRGKRRKQKGREIAVVCYDSTYLEQDFIVVGRGISRGHHVRSSRTTMSMSGFWRLVKDLRVR